MAFDDIEFDEWFEILTQELGSSGAVVDKDTARNDYELGMSPETSAILFIKQMNNGND